MIAWPFKIQRGGQWRYADQRIWFNQVQPLGEILTKIEYIVDGELANEKEAIIAYIQQAKEEENERFY